MMKIGLTFFIETCVGSSKFYGIYFATFRLDKDLNHPLHGNGKLGNGNLTVCQRTG